MNGFKEKQKIFEVISKQNVGYNSNNSSYNSSYGNSVKNQSTHIKKDDKCIKKPTSSVNTYSQNSHNGNNSQNYKSQNSHNNQNSANTTSDNVKSVNNYQSKNYKDWTTQDINNFLVDNDLKKYVNIFTHQQIKGRHLSDFGSEDFGPSKLIQEEDKTKFCIAFEKYKINNIYLKKENKGSKKLESLGINDIYNCLKLKNTQGFEIKPIGGGTFGKVYSYKKDNIYFAIKLINKKKVSYDDIINEINITNRLNHKNTIKMEGHLMDYDQDNACIILNYYEKSLKYLLTDSNCGISEDNCRSITKQLLEGLEYLHSNKIVHRDIKCSNILLDKNGNPVIADFGLSYSFDNDLNSGFRPKGVGTKGFKAPELHNNKNESCDSKVDIYSLGITVMEMLFGGNTLGNEYDPNLLEKKVSNNCIDFIYQCIIENPNERPSAQELLNHDWILNVKNNNNASVDNKKIYKNIHKTIENNKTQNIQTHSSNQNTQSNKIIEPHSDIQNNPINQNNQYYQHYQYNQLNQYYYQYNQIFPNYHLIPTISSTIIISDNPNSTTVVTETKIYYYR